VNIGAPGLSIVIIISISNPFIISNPFRLKKRANPSRAGAIKARPGHLTAASSVGSRQPYIFVMARGSEKPRVNKMDVSFFVTAGVRDRRRSSPFAQRIPGVALCFDITDCSYRLY